MSEPRDVTSFTAQLNEAGDAVQFIIEEADAVLTVEMDAETAAKMGHAFLVYATRVVPRAERPKLRLILGGKT